LTPAQEQMLKSLSEKVEQHSQNITTLVSVINKLSNAIDEGFNEVTQRLSRLEGNEGMKGVHNQLGSIKDELKKINQITGYDGLTENISFVNSKTGEA
jgi:uncharacterized coiled-coil DUF342 family protein